jgi:hypothetical protein
VSDTRTQDARRRPALFKQDLDLSSLHQPQPIHFFVAPTSLFFVARCFFFDAPTFSRAAGWYFFAASSRTLDRSWFSFDAWT